MKNILCFGDSLTWGFNPENASRYPLPQRWTGVLQEQLGTNFHVIEEGLNGRTTLFNDPFMPGKNGGKILPILLDSHAPLDLVILFLGSNDLKSYIKGNARSAALGCGRLIHLINASQASPTASPPKVLLLAPPLMQPKNLMSVFFEGAEAESRKFAQYYVEIARFYKVSLLDTGEFLTPSPIDGVHLEPKDNQLLGERVAAKLKEIFSDANDLNT